MILNITLKLVIIKILKLVSYFSEASVKLIIFYILRKLILDMIKDL